MKKTKAVIATVMLTLAVAQYCNAAEADCNGTDTANCHPGSGPFMSGGGPDGHGGVQDTHQIAYGDGDANVSTCTSSTNNCGACTQDGTVTCNYKKFDLDQTTGILHITDEAPTTPKTYKCS